MIYIADSDEVGIVGARLLYPDGSIQQDAIYIDQSMLEFHNSVYLGNEGIHPDEIMESDSESVEAVSGSCLLIRKETFHEMDGWDDSLILGLNADIALCYKLRRAGYRIHIQRKHPLIHLNEQSYNQ